MRKTFLIIAGETSGDKHAARLIQSMKSREKVHVVGIGGDKMKSAGVDLIHHVTEMSVMGFSEIISKLPFFRKVRRDMMKVVHDEKPVAVILVDYPGFNLRFAELAKKNGLKVIYFISPQVWAWGKNRIKKIRSTVDLMLTIFKFEEDMYRAENVDAHFVGHPLLDEITVPNEMEKASFRQKYVVGNARFLALLPGSRLQEINHILPGMLKSVRILKDDLAYHGLGLNVVVGCAPGVDEKIYREIIDKTGIEVRLCHDVDLLMSAADAGIVTSGTATLEAALHNLPIVVVYKTSFLTYWIGRLLLKLDSISLVNIVARQEIVHELVQHEFTPLSVATIVKEILTNTQLADEIRSKYDNLRKILGGPGASDRAAELILSGGLRWGG